MPCVVDDDDDVVVFVQNIKLNIINKEFQAPSQWVCVCGLHSLEREKDICKCERETQTQGEWERESREMFM